MAFANVNHRVNLPTAYLDPVLVLARDKLPIDGHLHRHVEQALAKSAFEHVHIIHVIINQMLNAEKPET